LYQRKEHKKIRIFTDKIAWLLMITWNLIFKDGTVLKISCFTAL